MQSDILFRLFTLERVARTFLRLDTEGVVVSDKRIGWDTGGPMRWRDLAKIRAIRFGLSPVPRGKVNGVCEITFVNGLVLSVLSHSQMGLFDEERRRDFGAFVRTLHERLSRDDKSRIDFYSGSRGSKRIFAMIFAAMAVVVVGWLFYFLAGTLGFMGVLISLAVAAALGLPLIRVMASNTGEAYNPDSISERLLP